MRGSEAFVLVGGGGRRCACRDRPLARDPRIIRCQPCDSGVNESVFFWVTSQADSDGYLTVSRRSG